MQFSFFALVLPLFGGSTALPPSSAELAAAHTNTLAAGTRFSVENVLGVFNRDAQFTSRETAVPVVSPVPPRVRCEDDDDDGDDDDCPPPPCAPPPPPPTEDDGCDDDDDDDDDEIPCVVAAPPPCAVDACDCGCGCGACTSDSCSSADSSSESDACCNACYGDTPSCGCSRFKKKKEDSDRGPCNTCCPPPPPCPPPCGC